MQRGGAKICKSQKLKIQAITIVAFQNKLLEINIILVLNERLKSARNRKGLTSSGVVRALKQQGVSIGHSTLQGYEADENSLNHRYPSLSVLMELANFYEVSYDYLIWDFR